MPSVPCLGEELQNGIQKFRIGLVGHVKLDVFGDTPTDNQFGPPSTSLIGAQPLGGCQMHCVQFAETFCTNA